MQTRATDLVLLDQRDAQSELGRPQRARVATAATPEDDDVVLLIGHDSSDDVPGDRLRQLSAAHLCTSAISAVCRRSV
jgi:hypothetical protein